MNAVESQVFFDNGSVVWELESEIKLEAIQEVIFHSPVFQQLPGFDPERFFEIVAEREAIQSTGFGHGVAVAHGRTSMVEDSVVALGISRQGIEYQALDNRPVHLLFVVATHPEKQLNYLKVLSSLVTLVRQESFRREIFACLCQEEIESKLCHGMARILMKTGRHEILQ
ncbi:PTS sugar transporter subunit IIA [Spirochaeta dissipatitropha]